MHGLKRLVMLAITLLLVLKVSAASRASFCKCMCKSNYTIIPLDIVTSDTKWTENDGTQLTHPKTCNDCNRQFCIGYKLPTMTECLSDNKGKEEDIVTQCFQRDSAKDQAVVYSFIALTVGLLLYAAVRPWIEQRKEIIPTSRSSYAQLASNSR